MQPDRAQPPLADLVDHIGRLIADGPADRPPLIGIAGAQGSGKTTLARAAADRFGAVQLSLDDVYLTQADREALARDVHPLLRTRGPPGTHDLVLLQRVIDTLSVATPDAETPLPGFDKRADDRCPATRWRRVRGRPSAILVDGWCLGATPQDEADLFAPINALERDHDPDRRWRRWVNDRIAATYTALAHRFDAILFLKAPDFDVVLDWRCEQEAGLLGLAPADLPQTEHQRLARFVQSFERVTRHMSAGGVIADVTVQLDRNRLPVTVST